MNLSKLFEMQRELDEHIMKNHQINSYEVLPNLILALQVELGELANEWRGFKHWSNDQQMRRKEALEEYSDCLHFILSIGLVHGYWKQYVFPDADTMERWPTTILFSKLMEQSLWNDDRSMYTVGLVYFLHIG